MGIGTAYTEPGRSLHGYGVPEYGCPVAPAVVMV